MSTKKFKAFSSDFTFEEAEKFFGKKLPVTKEQFNKLKEKYKTQAFTVSGYSDVSLIDQFYKEILKAIHEGTTVSAFRENMNRFLQQKGYEGISKHQADNIFRTNTQTAFNAGHYEKMSDPDVMDSRPYWQYVAVGDKDTRPTHLAMDGLVFRADDPIWDTWFPPNGYRCRCTVRSLSKRQVDAMGLKVMNGDLPIKPDEGFHTNPAKQTFEPDVSEYPSSLQKAYERMNQNKV